MRRIHSSLAIAGCALGLLAGVSAQVRDQQMQPARGTATIAGRVDVVAGDQRTPLRHATVLLTRAGEKSTRTTATDAEGQFRFDSLPAGVYRAEARKAGFVGASPAADLTLESQTHATAVIEVQRAGALEGRFFDDRGAPIERLKVTADLLDDPPARIALASYTATTDDLGRFRVHTLPPGRYRLSGSVSGEAIFYPGTMDTGEATLLTVASGQTVDQLDVTLPAALSSPIPAEAAAAIEREIASLPDTPAFSGRITGRVTRSDLGVPIPNATVQLMTTAGLTLRTATSDGNGGFAFSRLPEGRFVVSARAFGFINPRETSLSAQGLPITIAAGVRPPSADIALTPAGAIEVLVVDEFGDPAPGVALRVVKATSEVAEQPLGGTAPAFQTTGPTDDRGWFRASRLPAGEYYVAAVPNLPTRSSPSTLATTYFPGTTSVEMASTVRLDAGVDLFGVSFGLVAVRTATVSGVAVSSEGRRIPALTAALVPQGRAITAAATLRTTTAADGGFVFPNVPEGTYVLSGFAQGWFGTMTVTVSPAVENDQPSVVFTVRPPGTARGRVVFDGALPPPAPHEAGLFLSPTEPTPLELSLPQSPGRVSAELARTDGGSTFEIRGIMAPGTIRAFGPPGSPWLLARVLLRGRDITDVPYDFHAGDVDGIEVTLTSRVGSVSGVVKDLDAPVPSASVLIFGADSPSPHYVSRTMQSLRTDDQGAFQIPVVLPGRYYAIARRSSTGLGVSQLLELRARATLVTISESGNVPVTLTILK